MKSAFDAVIVGGGPAGLTASIELAHSGARVAIVEEQSELGGQYFKRRSGEILKRDGDFRPAGTTLIRAVREAGVACFTGHLVWGTQGGDLWTSRVEDGQLGQISGRALLITSGAYEKTIPFPGWTLPGVCTPGCALHFATVDRVAVGKRVLVAGSGPFLLPVACSLLDVGASVVGLLEASHPYRVSMASLAASTHLKRMRELVQYLGILRNHRVRIRQGWHVSQALGNEQVERVVVAGDGGERDEIEVDALCVAYGFRPSTELARLLGVDCCTDPVSGDLVPTKDDFGRTSKQGVYIAGEVAGIGGVDSAIVSGRLAGIGIAKDLGLRSTSGNTTVAWLRKKQARLRHFAHLTGRLFSTEEGYLSIPDETIVCRCESVTAGIVRKASQSSWIDLQAVKAFTRAGMGPCQGRECGATVARLVAESSGRAIEAFPARMPLKPIKIGYAETPTDSLHPVSLS